MGTKTDITLYTAATPNGIKIPILLEELGLEYKPWYLEINPNGRIPAITDTWTDGKQLRVFESGAILEYLVERYDTDRKVSYPRDSRYAKTKIEYGINRYYNETRRLYGTMESQLAKSSHGYLVGDRVTVADIACWGWVANHNADGVSLDEFPHVEKWLKKLLQRPGFEKGRHIPKRHTAFD
ncbi:Glutathione S-transferase 2 [Lecanicillium sp. MT-2017a]|nr:Glutathione S-transferase 2 [Lecanicillium sp. MT-2017a]